MPRPVAILALLALLSFASTPTHAADEPRTVSTSGEATVRVTPDEVVVGFGVQTFASTVEQARSRNEEAASRALAEVRALGVAASDIQTDVLTFEVSYVSGDPAKGVSGYTARRGYSVTLKDPTRFERLVETVLRSGANHLMGFEFRTRELRRHRDEARRQAVRASREKAELLASELGARLGPVRSIQESSWSLYGGYRSWWGWGGYGQSMMQQNVQVDRMGAGAPEEGEALPLGKLGVRAQVQTTFDLIPGTNR